MQTSVENTDAEMKMLENNQTNCGQMTDKGSSSMVIAHQDHFVVRLEQYLPNLPFLTTS